MSNNADKVIDKARIFAKINYLRGMDTFVECYGREEWVDFVTDFDGEIMEWKEVQRLMRAFADASIDLRKNWNNSH